MPEGSNRFGQHNRVRKRFHVLIMRLAKEWPPRTVKIWGLSNFLELPLVLLDNEKVKEEAN